LYAMNAASHNGSPILPVAFLSHNPQIYTGNLVCNSRLLVHTTHPEDPKNQL